MLMQADQDLQETQVDQDIEASFFALWPAWIACARAQEALFGDLDLGGTPPPPASVLGQALHAMFLCLRSCVSPSQIARVIWRFRMWR